jgi:hypothetical protein
MHSRETLGTPLPETGVRLQLTSAACSRATTDRLGHGDAPAPSLTRTRTDAAAVPGPRGRDLGRAAGERLVSV